MHKKEFAVEKEIIIQLGENPEKEKKNVIEKKMRISAIIIVKKGYFLLSSRFLGWPHNLHESG